MKDNGWLENLLDIDESTAIEAVEADIKRKNTRRKYITISLILIAVCIIFASVANYLIDKNNNKEDTVPVAGGADVESYPVKNVIVDYNFIISDMPLYEYKTNYLSRLEFTGFDMDNTSYNRFVLSVDKKYITSKPIKTITRQIERTDFIDEESYEIIEDKEVKIYQIENISKEIAVAEITEDDDTYYLCYNSNLEYSSLIELLDNLNYNSSNNFSLVYKNVKSEDGEYDVTEFIDVPSYDFYEYISNSDSVGFDNVVKNIAFDNNEFFELRLESTDFANGYIRFILNDKGYLKFCYFDQEYDFFIGKDFYDNLNRYVGSNCDKYRIEYIYK